MPGVYLGCGGYLGMLPVSFTTDSCADCYPWQLVCDKEVDELKLPQETLQGAQGPSRCQFLSLFGCCVAPEVSGGLWEVGR